MPTYEYVCKRCGHLFEIVQSMKDDTLTECPECGGELRKVFAAPAISFRGSGFYATDHGKKSKKPSETKPSESKPGSGSGKKEPATSSSGGSGGSGGSESSGSSGTSGGSGDSGGSGGSESSGSSRRASPKDGAP
jgi:putative FmdB family regulatory protein